MGMQQKGIPAMANKEAHFAKDGIFKILTKPHGHGDVHSLMHSSGTAEKWLNEYKVKWTLFLQDTNAVVFKSFIPALGVSKKNSFAMNTITVPRRPKQAA